MANTRRRDLRGFIDLLFDKNEIISIVKPVSPKYEIASYIRKSCDVGGPAFFFTNVMGYPNQVVVGGLYGTARRTMLGLEFSRPPREGDGTEITPSYCVKSFAEILGQSAKYVDTENVPYDDDNPPCQAVVESEVNLFSLPICTHSGKDKGPFITSGIQYVRNYDNLESVLGYGIHRMYLIDKDHLSCLAPIERRVGLPHYKSSELLGRGIPIAIAIGTSPADMLSSQAKVPITQSKYSVCASILGKPVTLTCCLTNNVFVPADAELILEGETVPNSSYDDTPFAEYPGCYSMRSTAFIVKINKITHRKDYIYETVLTGMPPQEDSNLCCLPSSAHVFKMVKDLGFDIQDVSAFIGNNVFDTIISIKKRSNAEVLNIMMTVLGNKYVKSCTIVDEDINVHDENDVRFAMNTRMQPNRDIHQFGDCFGASLDPSAPKFRSTSKVGYDCTIPIGNTPEETLWNKLRHEKVTVPGAENISW